MVYFKPKFKKKIQLDFNCGLILCHASIKVFLIFVLINLMGPNTKSPILIIYKNKKPTNITTFYILLKIRIKMITSSIKFRKKF